MINKQEISPGLVILPIPCEITDEEIDQTIKEGHPIVVNTQVGWVVAIAGYDDDDREVYQIPEIKILAKRLVERGLISLLSVSTLIEKDEKPYLGGFLGAMEIWSLAKGKFGSGELIIERPDWEDFFMDLGRSNEICHNLTVAIKEGQHKASL